MTHAAVLDAVQVFDTILFILLLIGNVLGLPIWWWLFGAPIVRLWKAVFRKNSTTDDL